MLNFLICILSLFTLSAAGFALNKTSDPNFKLDCSVQSQLYSSNPAISAYVVSNGSVLPPGLYVPPSWSFSVGFVWNTFTIDQGIKNVQYTGSMADGSKLPDWMSFSPKEITFQGFPPPNQTYRTFPLALHGSDEQGHELGKEIFNFTVAAREVSMTRTVLPPLNLTAGSPFSYSMSDLILPYLRINGKAAHYADISSLNFSIPAGASSSVSYTNGKLQGTAPRTASGPLLLQVHDGLDGGSNLPPLVLQIPFSLGSSYFSPAAISPIYALDGTSITFALSPYLSNTTSPQQVDLSASYEPSDANHWLTFNTGPPVLHGTVPANPSLSHVNVTFKAIDKISNSTSFMTLYISLQEAASHPDQSSHAVTSLANRNRVVVGSVLGVIGGFVLICCMVAMVRKAVGQKSEDALVRAGPRTGSPKAPLGYTRPQDSPFLNEKEAAAAQAYPYRPDDVESQTGSVITDEVIANIVASASAAPQSQFPKSESGRVPKKEFFKQPRYHPARFLHPNRLEAPLPGTPASGTRKVSMPSTIRSIMENPLSMFRKPQVKPSISKPIPYTSNSAGNLVDEKVKPSSSNKSSGRNRVLGNGPSVPSRSVFSFNARSSRSVTRALRRDPSLESRSGTDSDSLEGGISLNGFASEDSRGEGGGEVIGDPSYVWAHRPRVVPSVRPSPEPQSQGQSRSGTPARSQYEKTPPSQHSGTLVPAKSTATTVKKSGSAGGAGTTGVAAGGANLRRNPSDEQIDEGIVQLAYAINVKDRTSEPKLRRYSSLSSALEDPTGSTGNFDYSRGQSNNGTTRNSASDPSLRVLAGVANPFASNSLNSMNPSSGYTGSGSGSGNGASNSSRSMGIGGSVSRPAVIQSRDVRRPVPGVYRPGAEALMRKVSDRVEMGNAQLHQGPSTAAGSSHAVPQPYESSSNLKKQWGY